MDRKSPVDALIDEQRRTGTASPPDLPRPPIKRYSVYSPMGWRMEHRVALAIAMGVGAGLGLLVGYAVFNRGLSFEYWAWHSRPPAGYWAAGIGAGFGVAAVYLVKLLRH